MGKLNVIIVDATGNKEQKVGLPDDIKIGIIMVKLVEKIKLPSTGPDGNPISYKFIHKVTGRQLLETQTLADAQIKDGDVLRLQPEITAGAICTKCGGEVQDGVAFCTTCGSPMNSAPAQNYGQPNGYPQQGYPQQGYTQPGYTPYSAPAKPISEIVKILGLIAAGVFIGTNLLLGFIDYSSDTETFLDFLNVLRTSSQGLFMIAITLYMKNKLEK